MIGALLVVAQLAIVAHAPDTAATCDAIEISVAVSAPGGVPPIIMAPSLSPFDVLRSSGTPHVTYDSRGGGSVVAEYRYVITTDRVGTFAIPPFEARLGNAVARSRPTFDFHSGRDPRQHSDRRRARARRHQSRGQLPRAVRCRKRCSSDSRRTTRSPSS